MAYMRKIPTHYCQCGTRATQEVFNRRNSSHGYFCLGCARRTVQSLTNEEIREVTTRVDEVTADILGHDE